MKLNLGCGEEVLDGWINIDLYSEDYRVTKMDISKLPLPFPNNSIDAIRLNQVLEHLDVVPYAFLLECHRVLKPGGRLFIGLPGYSVELTHIRGFHPSCYLNVLLQENPGVNMAYTKPSLFQLVSFRHNWSLRMFLRKLYETMISIGSSRMEWELEKK